MMKGLEKAMGLPPLKDVQKLVTTINTLSETLTNLKQQAGSVEIGQFTSILQMISNMPDAKIREVDKTINDLLKLIDAISRLVKSFPPSMLEGLKLSELAEQIKGQMGK